MTGRNVILLLMVVGQTMAVGGWWNLEHQRLRDSNDAEMRQSTFISYPCSSIGAKSCIDCGSYPYCASTGSTANKITCKTDQVCESTGTGPGVCLPYYDVRVMQCECVTAYADDPYETTGNKYLTCLLGRAPIVTQCPTGQVFDPTAEKCSTPVLTTANCSQGPGDFYYTCRQAYYCSSKDAQPIMYPLCNIDEFFDFPTYACLPKSSLLLPAFACPVALDGAIIAVADNLECNAFRVCVSGIEQGSTKNCCPSGQVFSPQLMRCTTDPDIVACPQKHKCDTNTYIYSCSGPNGIVTESPITTVAPSGTSCTKPSCTFNGPYPYSSDCKQYYFCSGGKATVQSCTAQLFFDSTKKYCTKLSDFTGCKCV